MPSIHPTAKPPFAPTLLALSLAASLAVWGGPAEAAERHWTYISGCGSADWFGKTNGLNGQGQSTCWAASEGAQSGQLTPSISDDVFIQNPSGTQDLTNTFSIPNDPSRRGYANKLTISGTNGRFSHLALASGELNIDRTLTVGSQGKGKFTQTGGRVGGDAMIGLVMLGDGVASIGRYELTAGQADLRALYVGHGGHGELVQTGGTLNAFAIVVAEPGLVGSNSASSFFDVSGGSATIDNFWVGSSTIDLLCRSSVCGGGRARISGTASVRAQSVRVDAAGLLFVEGGTLSVTDLQLAPNSLGFTGGTIEFTGAAALFTDNPSLSFGGGIGSGTPTVRLASNTTLNVPQIHVGEFGKGKLELVAGARLTSSTATLGKGKVVGGGDGEAVVAGAGASWTITDRLDVGLRGLGVLKVQAGGSLTTGVANLGDTTPDAARGRNSVTVDGAGSRWQNNGDLVIGGGDATTGQASDVKLVNGGRLDNAYTLTIRPGSALYFQGSGSSLAAAETINQGLIDVDQGDTATLAGDLYLESGSQLKLRSPLTAQGFVNVAAGASIENFSTLTFEGAVALRSGALVSGNGTKVFAGGLSVGDSPGVFVDNSTDALVFLADTNTYLAEIGGTDIGSFDRYVLNGALSLGGTLKLVSWAGYTGQAGASFDLFDGTLSGRFASIDTSSFALAQGLSWDFSQLGSTGVLSITNVPAPIPEPGTWALWLGGLAALGGLARRRMPRATAQV